MPHTMKHAFAVGVGCMHRLLCAKTHGALQAPVPNCNSGNNHNSNNSNNNNNSCNNIHNNNDMPSGPGHRPPTYLHVL